MSQVQPPLSSRTPVAVSTGSIRARRGTRRWTSLVGVGLHARVAARIQKLSNVDLWKRRTAGIQITQLRKLLLTASDTEFGRTHDFKRLSMLPPWDLVAAYQRAVPQGDFAVYRAAVARMREQGEANVLWPGIIRDYAQTSGTTAGDKYIPVSKQMLRSNFLASLDIFANAARFGASLPAITNGRCLFLGGSTSLSTNEHGIRTGDLSGLVTPLIKWPITKIYSPGPKIALMSHWPSKIDAMAEACLDQDIRMISGMPSWALVLFEKVIELARKRGRRADCVRDVWPNLMLFVHGGVKYAPFDPRVRQMFSGQADGADIAYRLELYPASEGFIAMQDTLGDPGLRLLSDIGNFYEFIPLEEIDSPTARAFTCDQVEKGQRYVVTMSTCAGFWRYIIGDVVEFDSIPSHLNGTGGDGPCRLRIVGRHRHFINAFGENLIVEHIENAVAAAARTTGTVIGEFTAAPVYAGPGRRAGLELALEVSGDPRGLRVEPFRDAFDKSLKEQNVDYTTKRTDDVGMVPPTITAIPVGSFHRWLESKGKLGGQHKCPRCANHREIIEGLLSFATNRTA